jgi:alkylmercury lyase
MSTNRFTHTAVDAFIDVGTDDATGTKLLVTGIRLIAGGKPVAVDELAIAAGVSIADIERAPSAADIEYDDRCQIIGWGPTLAPTPHRFTAAGRQLYCWCAADTLLIPTIIGQTAAVASPCPTTGQTIRLTVHPEAGVTELDPPGAVITVPGTDELDAGRVRATTCIPGRFFARADAASDWQAQHPSGSVLPVADAYDQLRRGAERMLRHSERAS